MEESIPSSPATLLCHLYPNQICCLPGSVTVILSLVKCYSVQGHFPIQRDRLEFPYWHRVLKTIQKASFFPVSNECLVLSEMCKFRKILFSVSLAFWKFVTLGAWWRQMSGFSAARTSQELHFWCFLLPEMEVWLLRITPKHTHLLLKYFWRSKFASVALGSFSWTFPEFLNVS